jgi:hypothetical protein
VAYTLSHLAKLCSRQARYAEATPGQGHPPEKPRTKGFGSGECPE